jgi:HEAT repeat protein/type 1 glutamine amidotransferase
MRRCLPILVLIALVSARAHAAVPPPRRDLAEVSAVLARAPKAPTARDLRPLNVLLVANRKDHGPHEHDYPRWLERWKVLLGGKAAGPGPVTMYGPTGDLPPSPAAGAAGVKVETAVGWPSAEQLGRADLLIAFMGTGGIWDEAKLRDLKALLDRGAGFVALHSAVIAEKPHARPLADLLGLAWEGGFTQFRHGPLDLKIAAPDHPIARGLPDRLHFEDETYWPLVGDASRVTVLATAEEPAPETGRLAPQPMFWTHTVGKGRVFSSILGHYSWTFDDPYFRLLVLRGMAWAAGESPYRFDPLALVGARTTDRKPVVTRAPDAAPLAPEATDPNLLLWLDASDPATVNASPDGRVAGWANKAAGVAARLTSAGAQQPVYVAQALGGRPAVRFDGVDDLLRNPVFRQAAREWTIALVVTPRSNAGQFRALLAANRPGLDDFQTGFNIDLGPGATAAFDSLNLEGIQGGGAANLRTASAPFGSGQLLILSAGGGSARLWVNGQEEGGRGAGDAVTAMEELRLGGRFYMGQERGFFHGDVSEVLIYRAPLSDAQRAGLTAHLMKKYGPTLQPPAAVALDPWDYLPAYDWGATRRPLALIDDAVTRARTDPRARRALEARLIEVLADTANTPASRDFACRRLAVIGSAGSVPALATLLGDPALSAMACFALERIPGPEAERALMEALARLPAGPRLEVIQALGSRQSRAAVPGLARILRDPDAAVRGAAVAALGNIGGPAAVSSLTAVLEPDASAVVAEALLKCAERYAAEGRKDAAADLYDRLRRPVVPEPVRRAAVRAVIRLRGAAAAPLLVEQLESRDAPAQAMALLLLREVSGSDFTSAIAARLERLSPAAQARVLTVFADRGDPAARTAIRAATRSDQPGVRLAAIHALGRLGNATDVPALLAAAIAQGAPGDRDLAAAACGSLTSLSGREVDAALLRALEQGDAPARRAAAEALGRRGYAPGAPALLRAARGTEPSLRIAAIRALGETAVVGDVPALVQLLAGARDPAEAQAAETAITTVYGRTGEKERWVDALLAGIGGAEVATRAALLRALSLHGGPRALQAVRAAIRDPDPDLQDEALSLLGDWETPEPAVDLLALAKTAANPTQRTLALRGYLRMAALPAVPPGRRLEMCQEGLLLAGRDDERRLALAALAGVPTIEALRTALPFVEREGLAEEASAAVVAIAPPLLPAHSRAVVEAMDQVLKRVKSVEVRRQAEGLRARAEQAGR